MIRPKKVSRTTSEAMKISPSAAGHPCSEHFVLIPILHDQSEKDILPRFGLLHHRGESRFHLISYRHNRLRLRKQADQPLARHGIRSWYCSLARIRELSLEGESRKGRTHRIYEIPEKAPESLARVSLHFSQLGCCYPSLATVHSQ